MSRMIALPIVAVLALAASAHAEQKLTYADLVARMCDLARLSELPAPGETCQQCSSYDRASRYDQQTGKYIKWDANGDGGGVIRREGEHVVMAEMTGPGCIWRIWSARAQQGRVKIFLDGAAEPALDMPFIHYFDGKHEPFAYPELSYNLEEVKSHGQNLYFPIPFQKSCKIIAEKGWGAYYHFTYTTYPAGARLPTFSATLAAEHAAALKKVDACFRQRLGADPAGVRAGQETVRQSVSIEPGAKCRAADLSGARAIAAIRAKVQLGNRDDEMAALRKLALRITWDGAAEPAVWCPLGDFFGTAPGKNLYKSLTTGMTADGGYAYWYMPFAQSAVVEICNDDAVARKLDVEIAHAPLGRPFAGLGHFHAKWLRDTSPLSDDRWPDWVMLRSQGRGRFCGVMLHVWNPRGGWWGEGDEKFFVDGEKFPSTIGTGSEDYFGYAWCDPHLFQRPYHAQTMTENNRGHQSVLRWHIVDNVPFQKSFEACIEKYYRNEDRGTLYACLPVWYLAPGGVDPYAALPASDRHGYCVKPPLAAGGLTVLGDPPGDVQIQGLGGFAKKSGRRWLHNEQLWWTHVQPGAKLELTLSAAKEGTYEVLLVLTKARDYAVVKFALDGQPVGSAQDLYNPEVVPTEPVSLGVHRLTVGAHKLTVEIVGANPKAVKSYMFGASEVRLAPKP